MPKVTLPCDQCGRPTEKWPNVVALGRRIYCSRVCYDAARRKTTVRPCAECGVEFQPRQRQSTKFCSEDCRQRRAYVTVHADGYLVFTRGHPTHPNRTVHSVLWHEANRGARCADCGGAVEVVHHLDEDKRNNDLSNLVGLCTACHARRHNT